MISIPGELIVQEQQCYNMLHHWIFIGHIHSIHKLFLNYLLFSVRAFQFNYHHPIHCHFPVQFQQNVT